MRSVMKDFGDVRVEVTCMLCEGVPVVQDRHVYKRKQTVRYYVDPAATTAVQPTDRNWLLSLEWKTEAAMERDLPKVYRTLHGS